MSQVDQLLREICVAHNLNPACLERLLDQELNKKKLIRKKGLKQDIRRVLEDEVKREHSAQ
jgi:hypothetical protein